MEIATPGFLATLRFVVVGGLIVALMLPFALVSCVVEDRERHYAQAVENIANAWGGEQLIVGPVLVVPVARADPNEAPRVVVVTPSRLEMRVASEHHMRRLGIYEAPVFEIDVAAEGAFRALDRAALETRYGALRWNRALIAVGVSDPSGFRGAELLLGGEAVALEAGAGDGPASPGLRGAVADAQRGGEFSLKMTLRGSQRITAVPVGDRSRIEMTSTWPHPSFAAGHQSPDEYHAVRDDGFRAQWTIHQLARGFPSASRVRATDNRLFDEKDVGFGAVEPGGLYQIMQRSWKYGILFVVLTLVGVLCMELAGGVRFHVVQYGVAGVALVLFFLAQLALAEHVGFTWGYVLAAALLTAMISFYALGVTRERASAILAALTLVALYGVLYLLLRLDEFALLAGTGVLLLAVGVLMLVTRSLTPGAQPAEGSAATR